MDTDPNNASPIKSPVRFSGLARPKDSDPRKAKIVELRYFGGLSFEETAAVLNVSEGTVTRDWRLARGWLIAEIGKA